MPAETLNRPPLGTSFDVVVIGGGINGIAIARECARAGRRTLLLERRDFASGTTSRATRIIHGGLRYLQYAEIALVRECLREREHLLRERPHLVRPMNFVLALGDNRTRSALEIRAGLWLYRRLAPSPATATNSKPQLWRLESDLDHEQRWSLFQFEDAQCEFPERLAAEWLIEAVAAGATVRNYAEVLSVKTSNGRALGVYVHDLLTGKEVALPAQHIINATGPWADSICAASEIDCAGRMIGGVRGTHLILPRFPGMPSSAVYTQSEDGRAIFFIPWNGQVLFGTTEMHDNGDPADVQPTPEEVSYLLRALNKTFPRAAVTLDQVSFAYAGVRPLPFVPEEVPSGITRRHILRDHAPDGAAGMISVIGGKLTTAASLARDCARAIGIRVPESPIAITAIGDASGIDNTFTQWSQLVAQMGAIPQSTARCLAEWHAGRALSIARLAFRRPDLARPIVDCTEHILAEAVDAYEVQHAVTLGDILLRRVPVALSGDWDAYATRTAAERIGHALRWERAEIEFQIEEFEMERNQFLRKPGEITRAASPHPAERAA